MDVRQIEAYQAVMTSGTTSRAATALGVSQPAVSKAVAALERSVGFRLFDREKGKLVPTAEGDMFFREVQGAFAGLAKLRSAAARIRDYGSGDVRVGCLSAFSTTLMPAAVHRFARRNPKVRISLVTESSSTLRDMVAAGQLDVAVAANEINPAGVKAVPFARVRAVLALPPGHALADRATVHPSDLDGLPFVALAPEDTARHEAEALFARHGSSPRLVVETPHSLTVCALVLAGVGCGLVDPVTAVGCVERGLVLKPLEPSVHFRTLMLFPPRKASALVKRFSAALLDERRQLGALAATV
jgi:DNA-binding transcriptional LysR family regulator